MMLEMLNKLCQGESLDVRVHVETRYLDIYRLSHSSYPES